ncbi:MAG: DUF72 domain-containing protein [Methanomassiliicoccales archaeon]
MHVLIGCSGWSYDDWVGRFYPVELANREGEWFPYYARFFDTVEINSTYYHLPNEHTVNRWIERAREVGDFQYSVKFPRLITHDSMVKGKESAGSQGRSFEEICVEPMGRAEVLGAVLIQLSPHFQFSPESLGTLGDTLDSLSLGYPHAVEFRHRSWLDGKELRGEALDLLRERNVAPVIVDGPGFPATREQTADHAYLRFHGRNRDIWFSQEGKDDYRINRYDYLYSEDHLGKWESTVNGIAERTKRVRLYFNNHGRAKAVKNAFQMMDHLGIHHQEKEVRVQDQMTLGGYE